MTASALNSASIAATAAAGAKPGAASPAAAGAGAVAGFEALLAALFPQGAGATESTVPGAPQTAPLFTPAPDVEDAPTEDAATADVASDGAAEAGSDAAAALAAALAPQPPAATEVAQTTAADPSAQAPHAWGRGKAKGAPAQPALQNANPRADLTGKNDLSPEGADETAPPPAVEKAAHVAPDLPQTASPVARPAAPAATPASTNVTAAPPPPTPDAQPDAAPAPAPAPAPAEAVQPEAAPQVEALIAGQAGAKPEAAASTAPAPRANRSERAKVATEAEGRSDLKPLEAADKPVHAKAVDAAAKPAAASPDAKAPEHAEPEAEVAAEAPDAVQPAEARAAQSSAAPAAHTTHAVRGSPETVAHLAAGIAKKLEGQSTRFDLELNPQGLGKVDVRVEIGANGQLTASMLFDNAQAAQELKSRASELQRALEQAGFDLSGGLSFDVADNGRQQGQPWQDQGDNNERAFRGQAFRAALETAGDAADAAALGALRLRRGVNAGLDLRI